MIFRGLDSNDDWLFGKGNSDYLRDEDAIKANIQTRLKSWKGDCFFSPADGVDYNNFLDIGTKEFLDQDVRRILLQSDGVMRIDSFESEIFRDERNYSAKAEIKTYFGQLTVEV